jgi:hypothetical protein
MHEAHNFDVVGRSSRESPSASHRGTRHYPGGNPKRTPDRPINDAANIRPILDGDVHELKTGLYTLLAATGCLLLIACINVANLLVARAATRRRETAIRTALGGSRARLVREQIIESLMLSCAGGAFGFLLRVRDPAAGWCKTRNDIPRADSIHIDGVVILFATGVMLACGFLAGLIPALSGATTSKSSGHSTNPRAPTAAAMPGVRLRRMLLALQVGLTVVLLVGAGLLIKSYRQLRSVDLGCATHDVLTMWINLPKGGYNSRAASRVLRAAARTSKGHTRSEAAGLTSVLPGQGRGRDDTFNVREHPPLPKEKTSTRHPLRRPRLLCRYADSPDRGAVLRG